MQILFENDVKEYGTQALEAVILGAEAFENDVKEYGTQAVAVSLTVSIGLRMM